MSLCKGKNHRGIFGTPEEPIFDNHPFQDFPRILHESLINMASQNVSDIQQANRNQGIFRQGIAAKLLFLMCDRFQLSYQVKFMAIELFDRFMQKHIEELYNHVYTNSSPISQKPSDWQTILERVQKQLYLRIVSCCQIASKLTSHYKVISVSKAKRLLLQLGHNYIPKSIVQSELRILKTLDFHVAILSPLDFVETILQVLSHNTDQLDLPLPVYHSVCVQLLTVLYLRCDPVYLRLVATTATSSSHFASKCGLKEVQADKVLMAVGIIAAAAYISDPHHTDVVIEHLHRISQIPCEDIEHFVTTLVHEVQSTPCQ